MATQSKYSGRRWADERWRSEEGWGDEEDERIVFDLERDRGRVNRLRVEDITDPVIVYARDGRITAINALAGTLIGAHRSLVVGTPAHQVLILPHGEVGPRVPGSPPRVQYIPASEGARIGHVAGHLVPVDVLLCPDADGSTVATCKCIAADSVAIRDEEVAAIGHDLKNPLCVMSLELESLLGRQDGELDPSLVRMGKNLDLLDRLVSDLVDLSCIDASRFELTHRERIDLRATVSAVVERMASVGRISIGMLPSDPVVVFADSLRLERVLGNLLHNALKYSPVSTPVIVDLVFDGDLARVSVTDQGVGLTPAETRSIFEKFRRAPSAQDRAGTGLGLYVSRKIVEAHGGVIGVDSTPGEGSCFYFEIPLALHS